MKAIQGGKATNDKIDAQKIAVLLRGGRLPQASVSPAGRRATRDLLRRRMPLARQRGTLLAHVQHIQQPVSPPSHRQKDRLQTNRDGVAERFAAPAVPKSIEVARALLPSYDELLRDGALTSVKTAKPHDAHTRYLRQTVPGIGKLLSLVLLYAIHQIDRCPRAQVFAAYCRLGKCAKESAGKRSGTSGPKLGHAPLQGFLRSRRLMPPDTPAGQKFLTRLENKYSQGKALPILAHTLEPSIVC